MIRRMRSTLAVMIGLALVSGTFVLSAANAPRMAFRRQGQPTPSTSPRGQTSTQLSDGRWLIVGGEGATGTTSRVAIVDPLTGIATPLGGSLAVPRAWHTATVLPDGQVLITGGRHDGALVETPEILDPTSGISTLIAVPGAIGRAFHTATLLTDGRVAIAGGTNDGASPLPTEIWDLQAQSVTPIVDGAVGRSGHTATLLPDGRVILTGGHHADGSPARGSVIVDPQASSVVPGQTPLAEQILPVVAESSPADGATDVPLDVHVAVRFSTAMRVETMTGDAITVSGPAGPIAAKIVAAESGRLAFVWPLAPLAENTTYDVSVSALASAAGVPVVPRSIAFTTRSYPAPPSDGADGEDWIPDETSVKNGWRSGRSASPWESLGPLMAAPGVTAISGRVLTLDGRPLAGVSLSLEGDATVYSDRTGRFLLEVRADATARRVLRIDGGPASRPTRRYGFFEYGSAVTANKTNVLPFTIWMPKLDTAHQVTIPSPTTSEVVVTTPYIPGLELHIPPNTVITGEDGKPVTQISITPIPVDRPPFPLPTHFTVPVYFTVQPGGAYVHTGGNGLKGAQLVYPNYHHAPAGQRVQFYHYDPDVKGWYVYGMGTVTPAATQVQPDATTRLYAFTGAMFNDGNQAPANGKPAGAPTRADPVDPSTGIFVMSKTDLYLPDVIPVALTRTYNSGDGFARPAGRSMTHAYAMFLISAAQYSQVDLIPPEGGKVHYVRTSPGTGFADAVFVHQETATTSATPTAFYKSVIAFNGNGWDLTLKDGTVYVFGDLAPLQAIRDRYGNTVTIAHANGQTGNITQVTSPNGRWMAFTYDASNRITQARDNIGRTVGYTYDANGNLSTVTDPENGVTTYTYDATDRMAMIKDARNLVYLTNQYTNGRVSTQTLADPGAVYGFAYTLDGSGNITQTDITDPRGSVERLVFNSDHYITSDTQAYGTTLARTTTTERLLGRSNLVTAVVDGLTRRTEYTYDSTGHVLTVKRLAGTPDAVTTTFTYEPRFHQVATVTDPLGHTWTLAYDALGRVTSATDPLTHQTTIGMNAQGQVTSTTDALQHTSQFGYTGSDLTSVTDPLNAVQRQFVDGAGRVVSTTDALGRQTRSVLDKLNRVTAVTDPMGGQTSFAYDANSRVLSLTDALTHATTYAYDSSDRVSTRTDPLQKSTSFVYDKHDNLTQVTDRKGQVTGYQYDALDRLTLVTYADTSTTAYTYDVGDRVTQIIDSVSGTITRGYDGLDRLTSETTPEGTVSYTYDADGRRATMTVAGQGVVTYGNDTAHRLTSITQGTSVVGFTYDEANRRSTLTYPNGIVATYSYDGANRVTSMVYAQGTNTLGDLTYVYDAAGNRTSVGGSWSRTGLPQAIAGATYDAANRMLTRDGQVFSYDANGNLASEGLTSYTWNAKDQLSGLNGPTSASFAYDGTGRRRNATIGATSSNFLYDDADAVQVLSGNTPTLNLLTGSGVDETFAQVDSSGIQTLLTDSVGSTIAMADPFGTIQTQYTFEPFGAATTSGATSGNSIQFTGRENDRSGLFYYRARYYSPQLSRFISEDPLGFGGGDANLYAYAANNPINNIDPTGCSFIDCGKAVAELTSAVATLVRRRAERAAADRPDYGHGKAIEQAERRVRNALDKAKHCLSPGEIRRILLIVGGAALAITVPVLLPEIPWLVPALVW